KAGPGPQSHGRVFGERSQTRPEDRHLAQHTHDQEYEQPNGSVNDNDTWTTFSDGAATADEQAGPDNASKRDHRNVAWLKSSREIRRCDRYIKQLSIVGRHEAPAFQSLANVRVSRISIGPLPIQLML